MVSKNILKITEQNLSRRLKIIAFDKDLSDDKIGEPLNSFVSDIRKWI